MSDAIDTANSEVEALKEEMTSWRDNMSQSPGLEATDKFSRVSECADALEGMDEVDAGNLDDDSSGAECEYTEMVSARKGRGVGRSTRAGNASSAYESAASVLNDRAEQLRERAKAAEERKKQCRHCDEEIKYDGTDWIDDETHADCEKAGEDGKHEPPEGTEVPEVTDENRDDDADELERQADTCDEVAQECEERIETLSNLDFPDMFG